MKKLLLNSIKLYQALPLVSHSSCRHHPTCSAYFSAAVQKYGIVKGTYLGLGRLSRCHPWGSSGFNPVP